MELKGWVYYRGGGEMNKSTGLTRREQQVLRLVIQGKTNLAIARELGISERTVHFHLQDIYDKIGVTKAKTGF